MKLSQHFLFPVTGLIALTFLVPRLCSQTSIPARASAVGGAASGGQPLIIVNASDGVPIDRRLFGANNIWYYVPDSSFDAFAKSLKSDTGVTYMRFPGGFESEHYKWSDNTLEASYRNYTSAVGVTPEHILSVMGADNVSFVVRTQDAIEADKPEIYQSWATQAAALVTKYGDKVRDWQIGNEWYNMGGAHKNYPEFLKRYSTLVSYFAPAMKKAATAKGYSIRLFVTANWVKAGDVSAMRSQIPASAWSDVDGIDIHPYTGRSPSTEKAFPPLPISAIQPTIAAIKKDSGKDLIYASEWMASLQDDNRDGGLRNANTMMLILGEMARAGVTEAAYWPPVWPHKPTGKQAPQEDTVTLVHDSPDFPVDADGQAFQWLSSAYRGAALATLATNTSVTSIAARDGNQTTVFIMGGSASNETEEIQIKGSSWSKIVSAQVLYASDANVNIGPANISDITATKETVGDHVVVKVMINPGGLHRGSGSEIIKLVLR